MARRLRMVALLTCLSLLASGIAIGAAGQDRGQGGGTRTAEPRERAPDQGEPRTAQPREPARRAPEPARPRSPSVAVRGHVFIGGYFYDPFFGPYPWWPRTAYPYWYFPVYDNRAELRVQASPRDAAVYVDGFYAGIVDDFDGVLQRLYLPPGGHQIALYRDGYRTVFHNVYLRPGSTLKLHDRLEPLRAGQWSERPPVAPPVPAPPDGSYRAPRRAPPIPGPVTAPARPAVGFGTLEIRVQPVGADVMVDGERWLSSDAGNYVLQIRPGMHRVEVVLEGYQPFTMEVEVADGEATPLNVSLMARPK